MSRGEKTAGRLGHPRARICDSSKSLCCLLATHLHPSFRWLSRFPNCNLDRSKFIPANPSAKLVPEGFCLRNKHVPECGSTCETIMLPAFQFVCKALSNMGHPMLVVSMCSCVASTNLQMSKMSKLIWNQQSVLEGWDQQWWKDFSRNFRQGMSLKQMQMAGVGSWFRDQKMAYNHKCSQTWIFRVFCSLWGCRC